MDDDLPFDELYPEEDLNFEGIFYREVADAWSPSQDIDWEQEIDIDEEKQAALGDAATQFYYSNISHLMLCGRLLERGTDMKTRKLALFLAFAKMRNIEVFGRYLGRVDAQAEVAPYTKEYFSKMSENSLDILMPEERGDPRRPPGGDHRRCRRGRTSGCRGSGPVLPRPVREDRPVPRRPVQDAGYRSGRRGR
ncbi:MAG: hypothetical protein ABEK12_03915 [Candidatus Nanohaloarchaea archaeon]